MSTRFFYFCLPTQPAKIPCSISRQDFQPGYPGLRRPPNYCKPFMRVLFFTCEVFLFATTRTKEAKYGICRYAGDRRMPQRGFNPRLCLGWLDELVASHAGSRRPLLSTACDTARCNQPVIEGRDKSRPFFIWPAPSSNIRPDASRRVAPTGASPRHHASLLLRYTQDPWDYNQTRNSGTH